MYHDEEQRDFARELRNQPTLAEGRLWHFLRTGKLGVKFRRQAAIGPYIVDFVCFSHRLIVELDGPQHVEDRGKDHDARRTDWLASRGFRVIRFRNQLLDEDIWSVVEEIERALTGVNAFNAPLQELVTEWCWGRIWGRAGLDRRQRSLLNLAMIGVLNRPHELKAHVRGALNNGVSPAEIREVFLQVMIYAGVPAAVDSFRIAGEVFAEDGVEVT